MNTSRNRTQSHDSLQRRNAPPTPSVNDPSVQQSEAEFGELSRPENIVEHLSVPGFLRRIPHRWHMLDINRFGDAVGRAAEALHIAYLTRVDLALGMIRIFPVPLLKRVYETQAKQFGWPLVLDAQLALDEGPRGQLRVLRRHERTEQHLSALAEGLDPEVRASMEKVLQFVSEDARRLRKELGLVEPEGESNF